MRKLGLLLILLCILFCTTTVLAWGVWGHNHINKGAILALPKEMVDFFYNHSDYITEESTGPDLRKYTLNDKAEFPRHYINLERFNYSNRESMPATLQAAYAKYGKDSLDKMGILPWYIQEVMARLTTAFKNKRKSEILFLAADLGHYIGDAHMPLHTSVNSNGQFTGQEGIHAFWESELPELFGKNYNFFTGGVRYISDIEKTTWDIIDSSNSLVSSLLAIEKKMKLDNPDGRQYKLGADGKPLKNKFGQKVHTYEYAHVYHELHNGMVEKQMRSALHFTADFWYTAWVNAGKPDLSDLDADKLTERNKPFYKEDLRAWKKGKVKGCSSDKEY